METFSHGTLEPWWITGLADSQGTFTYNRNGSQIAVVFALKVSDRSILHRIQQFFGVGRIYEVKATKASGYYRVNRHDELPAVVRHFDAYPLQTPKAEAYAIWREMSVLKREFRSRTRSDIDGLAGRLSDLQARQT